MSSAPNWSRRATGRGVERGSRARRCPVAGEHGGIWRRTGCGSRYATAFPETVSGCRRRTSTPTQTFLASYDSVEIPYGIDEDGNEVVWRPAIDPNMMLIGPPGSGKTVTAHNLLVNFSRRGWPIWVLDGKYVEFLGSRTGPTCRWSPPPSSSKWRLVHRARDLMEFRYQKIVTGEADRNRLRASSGLPRRMG